MQSLLYLITLIFFAVSAPTAMASDELQTGVGGHLKTQLSTLYFPSDSRFRDLLGNREREVRVVHRLLAVGPAVDHLVTLFAQPKADALLELEATVIGTDRDRIGSRGNRRLVLRLHIGGRRRSRVEAVDDSFHEGTDLGFVGQVGA